MNTIVSAYGPFVMNVFEPLRRYSSPSRRAVDFIEPKASEPEPGSVMAHAPILSSVSRSSAHRSFWAIVPLLMMAAEVRPIDTPMAVTMPGLWRQISMIGSIVMAMALAIAGPAPLGASSPAARLLPLDLLLEALASHRVHAEGREELAQDVVGREVAELELVTLRRDLGLDELADRVPDHQLLF